MISDSDLSTSNVKVGNIFVENDFGCTDSNAMKCEMNSHDTIDAVSIANENSVNSTNNECSSDDQLLVINATTGSESAENLKKDPFTSNLEQDVTENNFVYSNHLNDDVSSQAETLASNSSSLHNDSCTTSLCSNSSTAVPSSCINSYYSEPFSSCNAVDNPVVPTITNDEESLMAVDSSFSDVVSSTQMNGSSSVPTSTRLTDSSNNVVPDVNSNASSSCVTVDDDQVLVNSTNNDLESHENSAGTSPELIVNRNLIKSNVPICDDADDDVIPRKRAKNLDIDEKQEQATLSLTENLSSTLPINTSISESTLSPELCHQKSSIINDDKTDDNSEQSMDGLDDSSKDEVADDEDPSSRQKNIVNNEHNSSTITDVSESISKSGSEDVDMQTCDVALEQNTSLLENKSNSLTIRTDTPDQFNCIENNKKVVEQFDYNLVQQQENNIDERQVLSNQLNNTPEENNNVDETIEKTAPEDFGKCIRNGCANLAVTNSEWENEFCSNECVIGHCKDVFKQWMNRKAAKQLNAKS